MNPEDIQKEYLNNLNIKPKNPAVKFRDGELSIQASEYHYCTPKQDRGPYTTFEVAYIENRFFEKVPELGDSSDDIYGYVPIETIINLLIGEGYTKKEILEILPR